MKIDQYISRLRRDHGIVISVQDDGLKVKMGKGAIDKNILEEIKARKSEIIEFFDGTRASRLAESPIPRVENREWYPLSSFQKVLYFLHAMQPESWAYNLPQSYYLKGQLSKPTVEHAMDQLLRRHDSLRTFFQSANGEVIQRVADHVPFQVEYFPSANLKVEELAANFIRPFDLSCPPLLRVGLSEVGPDEHILMVDMHHIITDGVSQGVLLRDFISFYNGEALPPLPLQYKDYLQWCASEAYRASLSEQKKFWIQEYAVLPAPLDIPSDFQRPAVKSYQGDLYSFDISEENVINLNRIAAAQNVSMFMLLLSVFNTLLHKITRSSDIVVGVPVAGRRHSSLESIIGIFINMLPVRSQLAGGMTFNELLAVVKSKTLLCYENQDYPFDTLVEELKLDRDGSHNPLFDVVFSYENYSIDEFQISGLTIESCPKTAKVAKFDLSLSVSERNSLVSLTFEYGTTLFNRETISRYAGYFQKILSEIIHNPDKRLADIEILSEEERYRLLHQFNNTYAPFPDQKTIIDLIEEQVKRSPDNIALIYQDVEITYREMDEKATQVFGLLRKMGIGPGHKVAIFMERSHFMVFGLLGVFKAGGAYVPVDINWPDNRVRETLDSLSVQCVLTTSKHLRKVNDHIWLQDRSYNIVCLDIDSDTIPVEELDKTGVGRLWDFISERGDDLVSAANFFSSYTDQKFTELEVLAYRDRVIEIARPWVNKNSVILEVGSGSGLVMFELSKFCGAYFGIDPSVLTQEKNQRYILESGMANITLLTGYADEVTQLVKRKVDVIILSSVIQFFPGLFYLKKILEDAFDLLNPGGVIIVCDVYDLRQKSTLKQTIIETRRNNRLSVDTWDMDKDLYVAKDWFAALSEGDVPADVQILHRDAIFGNELDFRYDAIIRKLPISTAVIAHTLQPKRYFTMGNAIGIPLPTKEGRATADDTAYIIFTSGSTGKPNGVVVGHRAVVNLIHWVNQTFDINEKDRLLFVTSICFDLSVYDIFGILSAGASVHIASEGDIRDPKKLAGYLFEKKITFWDSAPAYLEWVSDFFDDFRIGSVSGLRFVFLSGDWIPLKLPTHLMATFPGVAVIGLGGATEATVWSNYFRINTVQRDWKSIPYGRPIQNCRYFILDDQMKTCPTGVPGDLYIGGQCLSDGYINNEELTKSKFVADPHARHPGDIIYRTGDLARHTVSGEIEFLGRVDNQVKIRGFRIELGEIENQLMRYGQIEKCIVSVKDDAGSENYLVAYYMADHKLDGKSLALFLSDQLPAYMIPAYFVHIASLPLTANGKLDKRLLPEIAGEVIAGAPPDSDSEKKMALLWSDVLKSEYSSVTIDRSFFDLGGHSLKATALANRISKEFQVDITIQQIFKTPTVRSLAAFVDVAPKRGGGIIEKSPQQLHYKVTSFQRSLYFLYEMDKRNRAYNIPHVLQVDGPFDLSRFELAVQRLVERHEGFRTSFFVIDGELRQKVADTAKLQVVFSDGRPEDINSWMNTFVKPFDLDVYPILRVSVVKVDDSSHLIMLDTHHIIADGSSYNMLLQDLISLYTGKRLPELKLQYKDYADWQQGEEHHRHLEVSSRFWLRQFEEQPIRLELPTDHARPALTAYRGGSVSFNIQSDSLKKLNSLCQEQDVTVFMQLFTIYNVFLSKICNQPEIVVGIPTDVRPNADFEGVIGMFVNSLPVRSSFLPQMTFLETLVSIREKVLASLDNRHYPYESLVDVLNLVRDGNRNSLFDVMFSYQKEDRHQIEADGLTFTRIENEMIFSKFDLVLNVYDGEHTTHFDFEYSTDLFGQDTIERFVRYFKRIIEIVAIEPEIKLSEINIIEGEEQQLLIKTFNETFADLNVTGSIVDLFEIQVRQHPEKTAVKFQDIQITYDELNSQANALAIELRKKLDPTLQYVPVLMNKCVEFPIAILAVLKLGLGYVPLDASWPVPRILETLDQVGCNALLINSYVDGIMPEIARADRHVFRVERLVHPQRHDNMGIRINPDSPFFIVYTSGTTGKSKGAVNTHAGILNRFLYMTKRYGVYENDVVLVTSNNAFDANAWQILWPLINGMTTVIPFQEQGIDLDHILSLISTEKITITDFVPSVFNVLVDSLDQDEGMIHKFASLRQLLIGGEAMDAIHIRKFKKLFPNVGITNTYGPCEASIGTVFYEIAEEIPANIPIGRPIDNVKCLVLDDDRKLVPLGTIGELYLGGVCVGSGYFGDPENTSQSFVTLSFTGDSKPYYKTGDLVKYLPNGELLYFGRKDHQVKINGIRVELSEIETRIKDYPGVLEAIVLLSSRGDVKYLVGYYTARVEVDKYALRRYLSEHLPTHMVPRYYVQLEQMPLTANGKLDRRRFPQPVMNDAHLHVGPANEIEERLVDIWAEVLKLERGSISVDSNFFEVGGNSISIIKLNRIVNQSFATGISVAEMFRTPTIRSIASFIKEGDSRTDGMAAQIETDLADARENLNLLQNISH